MSTVPETRKRAYHHGDLRQVLLDSAVQILRSEGEEALSMRKLAAVAGVSRTASYHHFADKQHLLCAIAEEGFLRLDATIKEAIGQLPSLVPEATENELLLRVRQELDSFINAYLQFAVNNSLYYDLMFGSRLWKSEQLTESLKIHAHESFRQHVNAVGRWMALINANHIDSRHFAQVTWSTLHGMSRLVIDGIYVDQSSMRAAAKVAEKMFWDRITSSSRD